MTEEIINRIIEITGISSTIRLSENGGYSIYVSKAEITERFIDGGELRTAEVTLRCKGSDPSSLFYAAEEACAEIAAANPTLDEENIAVFEIISLPCFENCADRGMYIVACRFRVEYLV